MEAFRDAVAALGVAPAEGLSAFVANKFGLVIEPSVIPVYLASMRDLDTLTRRRQARAPMRQAG